MSSRYLEYLRREHERLEGAIAREQERPMPDALAIGRLKKLKLAVRDQIADLVSVDADHRVA